MPLMSHNFLFSPMVLLVSLALCISAVAQRAESRSDVLARKVPQRFVEREDSLPKSLMWAVGQTKTPDGLVFSSDAARPNLQLPDEAAGIDGIVRALISGFDQVDIVALGEAHDRKVDSDLRIALVRHPDFAKKVRFIVVEFGSTTEQATLDRYIRGENISPAQLAQIWRTTTQAANGVWEDPIYTDFFAAVRDVNSKLLASARIRVLGGDPGPGDNRSRETAAVAVLKEQVLEKRGKALVIYGGAHFYRNARPYYWAGMGQDIGIARMLEMDYP